jgi:hypothetical protein
MSRFTSRRPENPNGPSEALTKHLEKRMNQKERLSASMASIVNPSSLTVGYIAIGANAATSVPLSKIDAFGGQCEFVDLVCQSALLLDRVAVPFDDAGEHPANFYYEIAEPFGKSYGYALLRSGNPALDPVPSLREVMLDAKYDADRVDVALEAAALAASARPVTFSCNDWKIGTMPKGWYVQEPQGRVHLVSDEPCNNEMERTFARLCATLSADAARHGR